MNKQPNNTATESPPLQGDTHLPHVEGPHRPISPVDSSSLYAQPMHEIYDPKHTGGNFIDLRKITPILHGRWLSLAYRDRGLNWYGRIVFAIFLQLSISSRNGKTSLKVQLGKDVRACCKLPKHDKVNNLLRRMKQHGLIDLDTTTKPYTIYVLIDTTDCRILSPTKPPATPYPVFEPGDKVFVSDGHESVWQGVVDEQLGEHCYVWCNEKIRWHIQAKYVYPLTVPYERTPPPTPIRSVSVAVPPRPYEEAPF